MADDQEKSRSLIVVQTGWCGPGILDHTTPSAPSKEASLFFLMSRPPLLLLRREPIVQLSRLQVQGSSSRPESKDNGS